MEANNLTESRRNFIKITSLSGAVLALGFPLGLGSCERPAESGLENISEDLAAGMEINPFILIEESGRVTIFNPKPEMGQGTWQSLPLIIAEELDVDPAGIIVRATNGDKKFGNQSAGGSTSIRGLWDNLRKAGASAKTMLVKAAAQEWEAPEEECYASEGKVYHRPSGKNLTYGALVAAASTMEVPAEPTLKEPSEYKWLGKSLPRPDVQLKTNGKAIFGIDQKVPGMVYASIERCPYFHGKVKNIDDSETRKVKGVTDVIKSERYMYSLNFEGVAVIADNYYSALQGRKKLKVEWDNGTDKKTTTEEFYPWLRKLAEKEGAVHEKAPGFEKNYRAAGKKLTAQYETPFHAHAPLEPQCALIDVKENSCEVWAPIQGPDGVKRTLSELLKMPQENIVVNTPFMGGSFGRKGFYDYIWEAAHLSRQLKAPVKVIWTREDDIMQGPFRPGMLSHMEGYLDKSGNLAGFHHKVVAPSIQDQLFSKLDGKPDMWALGEISREAWPYQVDAYKTSHILASTEVPICWWRSVYCSTTFFGQESFIDEMAELAGKDPMDFRLEMLKDNPRFYNLLQSLREKSGWDQPLKEGQGKGVALVKSFGSIVGNVTYTGKDKNGKLKIEKVVCMIDCGIAVNPDNIRAQTEGCVIMGITAAIKEPITFKNGVAEQTNFHNYSMLRINETPEIEVHIVPSTERPGGVGEPGLPPVAPALTNAIFNATGKRVRILPVDLDSV